MSKKYTLNREDLQSIGRGALIAGSGALLVYFADLIPNVDFGGYSEIIAALLMILINAGRKYIAGKN